MPLWWAASVVLAGGALGWQALYDGPLDAWVLLLTLTVALILVAIGIWRLVPPPRD